MKLLLRVALAVGACTTCVVVFAIAVILVPPELRSEHFWPKLLWAEFLTVVVWATITGFFELVLRSDQSHGLGGILPALVLVVTVYAVSSVLVMVVHSWLPESDLGSRIHWAMQVFRFGSMVLMIVALVASLAGARSGAEPLPPGVLAPKNLAQHLKTTAVRLEQSGQKDLSKELKRLGERIVYGLPHAGAIGQSNSYLRLTDTVSELVAEITSWQSAGAPREQEGDLRDRLFGLRAAIEDVSLSLRR
jgi:hypothetical protein